jgi:hypothetical protein
MRPLTLVNTHYPPLMLMSPPTITNYLIEHIFFLSLKTYKTIRFFYNVITIQLNGNSP